MVNKICNKCSLHLKLKKRYLIKVLFNTKSDYLGIPSKYDQFNLVNCRVNPIKCCVGPVCADHVYTMDKRFYDDNYKIPAYSSYTLGYSIEKWMESSLPYTKNFTHIDVMKEWPDNRPCSGI